MSIMVLLHNNIPCAKNIFRMRQNFRQTFEEDNSFESDEETKTRKKTSSLTLNTQEERQRPQKVKTFNLLASPNIMKSFKFADNMSVVSSEHSSCKDLGDLYQPLEAQDKKILQGTFFDKRRGSKRVEESKEKLSSQAKRGTQGLDTNHFFDKGLPAITTPQKKTSKFARKAPEESTTFQGFGNKGSTAKKNEEQLENLEEEEAKKKNLILQASKNKKVGNQRRDSENSSASVEPRALNKFQEKSNIYGQSHIVAEID